VAQLSTLRVLALAPALNVPEAHGAQTTSLLAVAAAVVRVPAAHDELTAVHFAPLFTFENVVPGTHAAHSLSAVAEPCTFVPEPSGQVRHSLQALFPADDLNCPETHMAHVRSAEGVAAVTKYNPTPQTGLTCLQALVSSTSE
jgi:hypothetical protein